MAKDKGQTLEGFEKSIQADLAKFVEGYRKKHEENPEHYPLQLNKDNDGLWPEFFIEFITHGTL